MKTIFLQLYCSSLGFRFIQRFLDDNRHFLKDQNLVFFHLYLQDDESAATDSFRSRLVRFRKEVKEASDQHKNILLSISDIPVQDQQQELIRELVNWRENFGYTQIYCLITLSNPIHHCYTHWAEEIASIHQKEVRTVEEAYSEYDYPQRVLDFVESVELPGNVDITLLNNSKMPEGFSASVLQWLLLGMDEYRVPEKDMLKRELTYSELIIIKSLKAGNFPQWADVLQLMEETPVPSALQRYYPNEKVQQDLWMRNQQAIDKLNGYLRSEYWLEFDRQPHDPGMLHRLLIERSLFYSIQDMLIEELKRAAI